MAATRFSGFPETHWTVFSDAASSDAARRAALEKLAELYWRPVYAYLRARWNKSGADAMDLAQEFFLRLMDGRLLDHADPSRGRFRALLKSSLDHFVINQARADHARMRGGDRRHLSFGSDVDAERVVDSRAGESPDEALDRHWRRSVLDEALRRLEARGPADAFAVFKRYDLADPDARPTYDQLAAELRVSAIDIDTKLRRMRRDLAAVVREILASTVRGDEPLEEELRDFYRGSV